MSTKSAVIFGVTGQDGSYLSELLLKYGYQVTGVSRRVSSPTDQRIRHLLSNPQFRLVGGDVTDAWSVSRVLEGSQPHEIYNLAAQSHVGTSFQEPSHTWMVTAGGALNILEWVRHHRDVRVYQASSSEMFGSSFNTGWDGAYQCETTPMMPNSPYAIAKLAAHHLCRVYRESYGVFACSGILFNHESERRGENFVTRKISKWVGEVGRRRAMKTKSLPSIRLGNLDAMRDWGHAEDYVLAMWLMLQHHKPDDFVIATGEARSVRHFLNEALSCIDFPDGNLLVQTDASLMRPCEVPFLRGDATKARDELHWMRAIDFSTLVARMVKFDLEHIDVQNLVVSNDPGL